jgi:hypothetical protein
MRRAGSMGRQIATAIVVATCSLLSAAAFGQTLDYWTNLSGGNYETDSNWSLGAPGAYPAFNLGSSGYTIQMNQNNEAIDPYVETDNPTINLNNYTYQTAYLDVGTAAGSSGSLTLLGPGILNEDITDDGYVAVGSSSQLIVNGATVAQNGLDMLVSTAPGSTLVVENGGSVGQNDTLAGEDGVSGSMTLGGNLIVNHGSLVSGSFGMTITSATLTDGGGASSYGNVTVTGNVNADGNGSGFGGSQNVDVAPSANVTLTDGASLGGRAQ